MKTPTPAYLILMCAFILSVQSNTAQVVTNGLQSFYDFNGNAEDNSGNNLHGTETDVVLTIGIENSPNTAFLFNGISSNINCGSEDRNVSNQVTISAWIKTFSLERQLCVTKYNWAEDKGYFLATENGYAIVGGRDNSENFWQAISTTTPINDGEWHHITGIINQNSWQIWVDCNLEAEIVTTTPIPFLNCSDPLTIGYWYQGSGEGDYRYFEGVIDEVRVYNRPITGTEIDTLCSFDLLLSSENIPIQDSDFKVFPNPTYDYLYLESSNFELGKSFEFAIYNNLGQIMLKEQRYFGQRIDISNLASGRYTLKIFAESYLGNPAFKASFIKVNP